MIGRKSVRDRLASVKLEKKISDLRVQVADLAAHIADVRDHDRANRQLDQDLEAQVFANRHFDPDAARIYLRRELRRAFGK